MKNLVYILTLGISLNLTAAASSNLTVFIFKSPKGVSWKTPKALVNSTIKNYLAFRQNRSIGHAAIQLRCDNSDGLGNTNILAGMRDEKNASVSFFLKKKMGFGMLFYNFPGMLENENDLAKDINEKLSDGRVSFLQYQINQTTCRRLEKYYNEYKEKEVYKHYGLPNRPRYGEGAGCSAFAISFLELAGLLETEHYKNWSYDLRIPKDIIGGKLTGNKVGLIELLLIGRNRTWASEDEPHLNIFFWDPDSMFKWLIKKVRQYESGGYYEDYDVVKVRNAYGLRYDKRSVPTPIDPIWKF